MDAFTNAGFVIDRISEPRPDRETIRRFPQELARAENLPSFIVYRLLLRAGESTRP
jgi:hypothetical protein